MSLDYECARADLSVIDLGMMFLGARLMVNGIGPV